MTIPKARVLVGANGLPLVPQSVEQIHLCIGTATSGPMMTPRLVQYDNLVDTFKGGYGVKAAAYVTSRTEAPVIFVRIPATARPAEFKVSLANWTGGIGIAVTGSPSLFTAIVVKTINPGVVGVAGITYQISLDGGETFGSTETLDVSTAIVTSGVTITFTATQAFSGDFYVLAMPASASVYGTVVTKDGASGAITLTGTPIDQYEALVEVVKGGKAGTEGITIRYSLDGGRSFSATMRMGTGLTKNLVDYVGSGYTVESGLVFTLVLDATYAVGDKIVARTMPPETQVSDVILALQAVDDEQKYAAKYSFAHAVGNHGGFSDLQAMHAKMMALEADNSFSFVLTSARDQGTGEPRAEWEAALENIAAPLDTNRAAATAGYARIADPCGGWFLRRPVAFRTAERLVARPVPEALHDFSVGSVDDCDIFDTDGAVVEYDARLSSTLHDARYITLRTRKQRSGVFYTGCPTLAAPVGTGQVAPVVIPYRRILDISSAVLQQYGEDQLGRGILFANPSTGLPDEAGAQTFDAGLNAAITAAVGVNGGVAPGALAVQSRLSRTDPLTGSNAKLKTKVRIVPIPLVGSFEGEIALSKRLN